MPIPLSSKEAAKLIFSVPLIPPGVNHYVKHTRRGRHYVTDEARKFKEDMTLLIARRHVVGKYFQVYATFYLGKKHKGDVDGFAKCLLDSLADAGVFRSMKKGVPLTVSDAHVIDLILRKRRDRENPRTEIEITVLEGEARQ